MMLSFLDVFNNDAWVMFLEFWFMVIGAVLFATALNAYKTITDQRRYGAAGFWGILGVLFMFGKFLPSAISGILVLMLGVLSFLKTVNVGDLEVISQAFRDEQSKKIGGKIFVPSLMIALGAFSFSFFLPKIFAGSDATVIGNVSIGLSALLGLALTFLITKTNSKTVVADTTRLVRTMGSASILPQLLSALGAVFTVSGVGAVISELLSGLIPSGSILAGAIAYCFGMAIFTMIMGNGFAAFTVITVGIGVPFVFNQGGDPVIASALAMTAGFCGTLLTPMAANFNIVPATLLETKSQYTVIKYQAPFAIILLIIHVILMVTLAF